MNLINKLQPLQLGKISVWPPVVLAPMAGITHYPFRALCAKFGSCLTVSEMVTARPLVENNKKTQKIASFGHDEQPRSIQLYGIDPFYIGEAVKMLVANNLVDHIDLNFGCPVKKVTSRGGGAALPYKVNLLSKIIKQAVSNAEYVPITVKFRKGINDEHLTYLDTGKIAENEGATAIALHARTAAQMYAGQADWSAITKLKQHVTTIPVLGNGDIFTAADAVAMLNATSCDGVVIGRGCLGRPWLFRDLENLLVYNQQSPQPDLHQVVNTMLNHLDLMIDWFGETAAILKFRKDACYYLKGFHAATKIKALLMQAKTKQQFEELLVNQNLSEPYPVSVLSVPRGKSGRSQTVKLPHGFLNSKYDLPNIDLAAESDFSGG